MKIYFYYIFPIYVICFSFLRYISVFILLGIKVLLKIVMYFT